MKDPSRLHYPKEWLELGLLDEEFLSEQLARFDAGEDTNSEHYRIAAFNRLLARKELSDLFIDRYVRLAQLDPYPTMVRSALIGLIDHPALSDDQLTRLAPYVAGDATVEKRLKRRRLLRELRPSIIELPVLARCASEGDAEVHRILLSRPDLPDSILAVLQRAGASRAIRNQAAERCRARSKKRR